jgi:DNA-binding IclR family transcriptional regulator
LKPFSLREAIKKEVREHRGISMFTLRAKLADRTGLQEETVESVVQDLVHAGTLERDGDVVLLKLEERVRGILNEDE